ncbi:MAG: hypothetical protein HW403_216 [Dehalococcoidia bacterium]|nr:hypothetical protein [Dehalococcoidia bacterium]
MPITKEQFQKGLNEKIGVWADKITEFLALHENEAFTEQELRNELGLPGYEDQPSDDGYAFGWAFEHLLETRAVEGRVVSSSLYYAIPANSPTRGAR